MARVSNETVALASYWSTPSGYASGEPGRPLICLASTYTFHASFFESELLPRFLGLKFDETEGTRPFIIEREQALAAARVAVLVDADHLDPSQTTLRWDQLPVRVPRGLQHSKVSLFLWENCARLIVSSANLTRQGYRRNREVAGVIDFFDHESSAPRRILIDAVGFLRNLSASVRASVAVKERLMGCLSEVRSRVGSWRQMPTEFSARARPQVTFVAGLSGPRGNVANSPIEQLLELWGNRRADEVTVMTPFVGDLVETVDPVVNKLLELKRARDAVGYLVVPGRPSEDDPTSMLVGLPRRFLNAWSTGWGVEPSNVATYVVPLCRDDEKINRDLHAKGVLIGGDGTTLLFCGSSNFSPHGMGVGAANAEANLCYIDDTEAKRDGRYLEDRVPANWEKDLCSRTIWPEIAEPIDDEKPSTDRPLPPAFLYAIYNQCAATISIIVDATISFPIEWSLRWPGEAFGESPPIVDHLQYPRPPSDGRMVVQLPLSFRGANIAALRLIWQDEEGNMQSALLSVQVEDEDSLLAPAEFRSLTANGILECLLSGREPAEWIDVIERRQAALRANPSRPELDSLRAVDTSSYLLYRTRRLGTALAALGERLVRTVRTRQAIAYRLRQDPLGPLMLAEALVHEWEDATPQHESSESKRDALLFNLAEMNLTLAYAARRLNSANLLDLFYSTIDKVDAMSAAFVSGYTPPANLAQYLSAVRQKQGQLLDAIGVERHAS